MAHGPTSRRRYSIGIAIDWFFFVFAGAAAAWLAYLSLTETFRTGWAGILVGVLFWGLLAYLVLPRVHRILTTIYVPDYFIGRTRTSDGLLGDPVNLAFLGDEAQLELVMRAAGWTRADPVTLASSWRIVVSTLRKRSYDEAPVSPLFLFGRQQDFAYQQEMDGNPRQRHHVRFWRCPEGWLLPGGRRVDWLAAGTFDTSVGLSLFTLQVTHKIDADTDVERDYIVQTVSQAEAAVVLDVIEDFSPGYHARPGGGDSIRTAGDLPIVDVRAVGEARADGEPPPAPGRPDRARHPGRRRDRRRHERPGAQARRVRAGGGTARAHAVRPAHAAPDRDHDRGGARGAPRRGGRPRGPLARGRLGPAADRPRAVHRRAAALRRPRARAHGRRRRRHGAPGRRARARFPDPPWSGTGRACSSW